MARKGSRTKLIPIAIVVVVAVSVAYLGYLLARGGPTVVNYKTYTNENFGFKIDYPSNWTSPWESVLTGPYGAVIVIATTFYSGDRSRDNNAYIEINVLGKFSYFYFNPFENHIGIPFDNLTRYISRIENEIENDNSFVLRSEPTEIAIDGHYGARYSFTSLEGFQFYPEDLLVYPMPGLILPIPHYPARVQVEQFVENDYIYSLQMLAPEENFAIYEPIFEHVIDSFSFLKG